MPPKSLTDLEIYRLAKELNRRSYPVLAKISSFAYRNQMMRSSLSVPSNIAEGYGRHSKASFHLFLRYSMGSIYEFQLQLELAADNGVIKKEDAAQLIESCDELIAKMTNYMKWLKK
jgi:four helix bundle protein